MVFITGHHKQGVRQTVEVWQHKLPHRLRAGQHHHLPFSAAANGTRQVQIGRPHRTPWQDEILQRSHRVVQFVDQRLQPRHVALLHLRQLELHLVFLNKAEIRTNVEQLVLYLDQWLGQRWAQPMGQGNANGRIQLVDGTVGLHTQRVFGYALPATQAGGAIIPFAGINLGQFWHWCLRKA